jgi:hypothetical protein
MIILSLENILSQSGEGGVRMQRKVLLWSKAQKDVVVEC